jgi:uncharacterized sulfatase
VASAGVLFRNSFAGSPGCSPSRAALLTGMQHWQVAQAGTHASSFPARYVTFMDLLEHDGYFVGFTGKGWGPGDWKVSGRARNPAGPEFSERKLKPPTKGISDVDYAANFADFLAKRAKGQPFCFWYGSHEPHRPYEAGSAITDGRKPGDVNVPPFLPDAPEVRSDLLDYAMEVGWFDRHLEQMLHVLEQAGELDNTLVIVTADNGMPFPRAKANLYDHGIHVPLAIGWPRRVPGKRTVDDLVGFVDLTATILDAAGVKPSDGQPLVGRSLMNLLASSKQGLVDDSRQMVFAGRERHSSARYNNLGYPGRMLRTRDYLYIRNFHPERWPAGDPQGYDRSGALGPMHGAYHDIDEAPTLDFMVAGADRPQIRHFLDLAVRWRPAEELFDIRRDPACIENLAGRPAQAAELKKLREAMDNYLRKTGDPRMGPNPEIWETYPRLQGKLRSFPKP